MSLGVAEYIIKFSESSTRIGSSSADALSGAAVKIESSIATASHCSRICETCHTNSDLWENAITNAVLAVYTKLLDVNWQTGQYIVDFEQGGNAKAKYGDWLLVDLSNDLTRLIGSGVSRSNLVYMSKLYLTFPKCETLSHQLT